MTATWVASDIKPGDEYEFTVPFSETGGNDFQGDTFDLTMIFTLNQDASQ